MRNYSEFMATFANKTVSLSKIVSLSEITSLYVEDIMLNVCICTLRLAALVERMNQILETTGG